MKLEKRDDRKAKCTMLHWLRIKQRCPFIATEVGSHSADCIGVSEKKMIEVEVKINIPDFIADFKKSKHHTYCAEQGDYSWQKQWVPTHFYYAVKTSMVDEVKELLAKKAEDFRCSKMGSYGVIDFEKMQVEKRAQWIHKREPNSHVKYVVALRMGSELLRFHEAWL